MSITIKNNKNNKKNKLFKLHKNKLLKDKNKINYSFFSMKYKNFVWKCKYFIEGKLFTLFENSPFSICVCMCIYIYKGAVGETSSAPFSEWL